MRVRSLRLWEVVGVTLAVLVADLLLVGHILAAPPETEHPVAYALIAASLVWFGALALGKFRGRPAGPAAGR